MSEFFPLTGMGAHASREAPSALHKTRIHPQRTSRRRAGPTLFWPVATFLLSASVSLLCWYAYNDLPPTLAGAEKHLRQAEFSSKFNATSAEGPVAILPKPSPEPQPHVPAVV